jgi:hypothetical protein
MHAEFFLLVQRFTVWKDIGAHLSIKGWGGFNALLQTISIY